MTTITKEELNKIRARYEAATSGPWTYNHDDGQVVGGNLAVLDVLPSTAKFLANGEFAAAAREDVPFLVEALEAAEKRIKWLEKVTVEQHHDRDRLKERADKAEAEREDLTTDIIRLIEALNAAVAERDVLAEQAAEQADGDYCPALRLDECPHGFDSTPCGKTTLEESQACWLAWAKQEAAKRGEGE